MSRNLLTMSRAETVEACPWLASDKSPDRPPMDRRAADVDQALGRAWHYVVRSIINDRQAATGPAWLIDKALSMFGLDPEKYRIRLNMMRPVQHGLHMVRDGSGYGNVRAEVSYAIYPDGSAKEIGVDLDRQYPYEEGVIYGTGDTVHQELDYKPDGVVEMTLVGGDWKCGSQARQEVTPAARNKQLALLAKALFETYHPEYVRVELRFIDASGDMYVDAHTYDSLGIAEIDCWIGELDQRISEAQAPTPGAHCAGTRCPLLSLCPAVQQAQKAMLDVEKQPLAVARALTPPTELATVPLNVTALSQIQSPQHAGMIYAMAKAMENIIKAKIELIKAYVEASGPVPLGNGKMLSKNKRSARMIRAESVDEVKAVLAKFLPAEDLNKALIYATCNLENLEQRIALRSTPETSKARVRSAMTEIRNAGLFEVTETFEFRPRKPKAAAAAGTKETDDDDDASEE